MTRIEKAKELLNKGAKWRYALEFNSYTGRSQFNARLVLNGNNVRGYGIKTFLDMKQDLVIADKGTSVSTYYILA